VNSLKAPIALAAVSLTVLVAASSPSMLTTAAGGLWEIERSGSQPNRRCVARVAELAQLEHRGGACTRVVIREGASSATIHYTCPNAGFGESEMTLITPRSMRIKTQGISRGAPFNYVVQARRVGDC